jgi:hypothetical protein
MNILIISRPCALTRVFAFTLLLENGEQHDLVSKSVVPHDIEHLIYGLGYTEENEEEIGALARKKLANHVTVTTMYPNGRRIPSIQVTNPELDLSAWFEFLNEQTLKTTDFCVQLELNEGVFSLNHV